LGAALETIGLWLADALRGELARLGELCLGQLSWLVGLNRHALEALANPLVLWLVLLSILTLRALVARPARLRAHPPIGGAR
jgi:hypothetical protein